MDRTYPPPIFNEVLDFMVTSPTPEQIVAFKPSDDLEQRMHHLLEKNARDTLSMAEQTELDAFTNLNHFMNILKIRARQKLANS